MSKIPESILADVHFIDGTCPWDEYDLVCWCTDPDIHVVKFMRDHGCPWNDYAPQVAAEHGQLECLTYLHESGCPWEDMAICAAAENGHRDCLEYLVANDCPYEMDWCGACYNAAKGGSVDCLRYLHENGFIWDEATFKVALEHNHTECLEYLVANDCPMPTD